MGTERRGVPQLGVRPDFPPYLLSLGIASNPRSRVREHAAASDPGSGYTFTSRPAQYGSRSSRLTSLPALSRGKSWWKDTSRGTL
jgi:hypothetical protein